MANSKTSIGLLALALLCGCGGHDLTTASGRVTYQGQPLAQGRVGFQPPEGRPAFGDIVDGKFTLTTFESNDGVGSGPCRVWIQSSKLADPNDAFSDQISLIPAHYGDPQTSGLTAEINPGEPNVLEFKLVD